MTQNTSTAVMQRRVEPHTSLDDFPTPPWATRALCEWLMVHGIAARSDVVREPAANRGFMVRPLSEYFRQVEASDVHNYGAGYPVRDYLEMLPPDSVDWTITNPPFRLAEDFARRMIDTSRKGCAIFIRSAFTEGVGRHKMLFSIHRPRAILQFTERVPLNRGKMEAGMTTATAYCWIVWERDWTGPTEYHWIAPCRKRLERATDYEGGGVMGYQAPVLLTPNEAAAQLQISTKTLRRLRDKGLPYVMLTSGTIRYKAADLDEFIAGRTIECHTAPQARATGITTSRSKVVAFTDLAARKIMKKPKR